MVAMLVVYLQRESASQTKGTREKKLDPKQVVGAPRCLWRPLCCRSAWDEE